MPSAGKLTAQETMDEADTITFCKHLRLAYQAAEIYN